MAHKKMQKKSKVQSLKCIYCERRFKPKGLSIHLHHCQEKEAHKLKEEIRAKESVLAQEQYNTIHFEPKYNQEKYIEELNKVINKQDTKILDLQNKIQWLLNTIREL